MVFWSYHWRGKWRVCIEQFRRMLLRMPNLLDHHELDRLKKTCRLLCKLLWSYHLWNINFLLTLAFLQQLCQKPYDLVLYILCNYNHSFNYEKKSPKGKRSRCLLHGKLERKRIYFLCTIYKQSYLQLYWGSHQDLINRKENRD